MFPGMGCHLPNPSHACACGREVWPSHFTLPHLQDLRLGEAQVASGLQQSILAGIAAAEALLLIRVALCC